MRVAVFGAGYAGLTLARELERALPESVDLVVVDEDSTHVVQHEIHRVVRRPSLADEIRIDLDAALDRATVREATVTDVDPDAGVADLDGETVEYDYGAVCLGAETAFYDLPGVESHATPLKRIEHARTIREGFLEVADRDEWGTVVVGGAGLSGIQVAGELAALAREEGVATVDGHGIDEDGGTGETGRTSGTDETDGADGTGETDDGAGEAGGVEILLLEQEESVAPQFPANFQRAVRGELESRGVTVRTGAAVERADADGIDLASGRVAYDQFVWTGGIRGPRPLGERPVVRNTLRLADGTFVLGDAARVVDTDGEAVPASAQAAIREARVAATNLRRLVEHDRSGGSGFEPRLEGYTFDSPGWLVSVGDGAVAQVGPTVLTGRAAIALKTSVGAGYLTSVGAVENAVDLVREELGWTGAADGGEGTANGTE